MAMTARSYVFIHGLNFIPSDEELMSKYLLKKFHGEEFYLNVVEEYDVYSTEPWNLPRNLMYSKDGKVYYFSEAKRLSLGSRRLLRPAGNGHWFMNGCTKKIYDKGNYLGNTTSLNYIYGPTKKKTRWVMHEYRINPTFLDNSKNTELVLCSIQESGRGEETSSIIMGNSSSNQLLGCSDLNVDHGPDGHHATRTEPLRITSSNCNTFNHGLCGDIYRPEIALPPLKRSRLEEEGFLLGSTSTEAEAIKYYNFNGDFMNNEENVLLNGGQTTYHNNMCPPYIVGTHQVSCMESLEPNFISSTAVATSTREDEAHADEMLQYSSHQQQQQQQQFVGNEHVIPRDMTQPHARINFTSSVEINFTSVQRSTQTMQKI